MTLNDFINALFDLEDWTCFTDSPFGTSIMKWPEKHHLFFSINAMEHLQDLNPTEKWHSKDKPRRADHNVVKYRNIVLEIDSMPLDQQIEYVTKVVPVTSIVYSGGKSHHFIISLETPLKSKKEYATLVKRLMMALPAVDPSTKNPSRLSRLPFRFREETGKAQTLIYLGPRIAFDKLDALLPAFEEPVYLKNKATDSFLNVEIINAINDPEQVMAERNLGGRNALFFWLGNRLKDTNKNYNDSYKVVETVYSKLKDKTDFSFEEALMAARVYK